MLENYFLCTKGQEGRHEMEQANDNPGTRSTMNPKPCKWEHGAYRGKVREGATHLESVRPR